MKVNTMKQTDPRTKLALGIMAVAAVLVTHRAGTLAAGCAIVLLSVPLMGMGRKFIGSLRLIGPMLGLVFVMGLIFFDLKTALFLGVRLVSLMTVSFIFFQSVAPEEMGDAMGKLGMPFAFSFILTASLRYVPLIGRKTRGIIDAQQARGIDLKPRIRNISHFMALFMPLLVQAFILSDELALAMESRGFGCKNRTSRRTYHITPGEYALMAASLALLAALIWWENG